MTTCGNCNKDIGERTDHYCQEPQDKASSGNSDLLSRVEIVLPKITDELWEMFGETQLMTWDKANNRPHWTQDAVDIAAHLEIRERAPR